MNNKKIFSSIFKQIIKLSFSIPVIIFKYFFTILGFLYNKLIERLRFSLTFKINIVYAMIISFILLLLSLGVLGGFLAFLGVNAQDNMENDFEIITSYINTSLDLPRNNINQLSKTNNISVAIFDDNQKLLHTTEENDNPIVFYDKSTGNSFSGLRDDFMLINENIRNGQINISNNINNSTVSLVLNKKIEWNYNSIYIQISSNLSKELLYLQTLTAVLFVINIVFIIIILLVGSRASKRTLMPIERMTKIVQNITINDLGTRLDVRGSQDELKDLARTFNNMLDRIQQSYEQQNQFVSDASHELRTPISVIQGYINMLDRWGKNDEAVLEESISAIKSESENMKDLVEKLLFLARGDKNTQRIEKEDFYINDLIDEVVKETRLIDISHEIINEKNEVLLVKADRKLLKEALRIFIDNSIKYTPEGGKIKVSSISRSSILELTVEDTGIGIPKEDLPHIFNRFYRSDKSRTKQTGGTGLGLAIAKWIILKHEGSIKVHSEINVGTKVIISLPINI